MSLGIWDIYLASTESEPKLIRCYRLKPHLSAGDR